MDAKSLIRKISGIILKIGIMVGMTVAFVKLPAIIADKISYYKIKNTPIKQEFTEEE